MSDKLPADVAAYLAKALPSVDWRALDRVTGDLCAACPQAPRRQPGAADPVCYACPWFGYRYGAFAAEHWHPRPRPGRPRRKSE